MVGVDGFTLFVTIVICVAVALAALLTDAYLRREDMEGPEFYVLMLLSAAGGVIMAMGNDLIVIFIGLETLSIAVYVLSGMHLRRIQSQESGIKYFVLGAFSSAFFLYGIALIYGATGSTNLVDIKTFMSQVVPTQNGLLLIGLALLRGRPRLQGLRRAVPRLEPRRLRRRPHARPSPGWPRASRPPPSPAWSASSC